MCRRRICGAHTFCEPWGELFLFSFIHTETHLTFTSLDWCHGAHLIFASEKHASLSGCSFFRGGSSKLMDDGVPVETSTSTSIKISWTHTLAAVACLWPHAGPQLRYLLRLSFEALREGSWTEPSSTPDTARAWRLYAPSANPTCPWTPDLPGNILTGARQR